jgi:CRISPR/Cas system-associated exonuclease Cas4 (RecB family)
VPLQDLPHEIKNYIYAKATGGVYNKKPNTYSLTDLLYCVRKAWFKKRVTKPLSLESAYNIFRGKLWDETFTPLFPNNQVRTTYKCKNVPITISGIYDFLTSDNILTDLKTTKNLYFTKEAAPEYQKQVRFYAWLNSIEQAQIIYMDFGDAKIFSVEVGNCTELLNELERQASSLYTGFKTETPPDKQQSWLCGMCEYKTECENTPEGATLR